MLLAYAILKDKRAQNEEALKLYQKAIKADPKDASVYNNLAIHYARLRMFREAVGTLQHAIKLQPKEVKYRNNLATVLVQMNMPQEAFVQLLAVHDEAVAHYNLGFLMVKNRQPQQALQQFQLALRVNPSMVTARQWMDRLQGRPQAMPQGEPGMLAGQQAPPPPNWSQGPPRMAMRESYGPAAPLPPGSNANPSGCRCCTRLPLRPGRGPIQRLDNPDATRRLPPVPDGSAATLDLPKFPSLPPDERQQQVGPLPPDRSRGSE